MSNKILIIDAMNAFIRNYVMNPSLAADGSPIGGTKGFLMSLQKMTREIQPDNVIVVWDGGGGSAKRRTIVKEYKEGRKPLKLNRAYKGMSSLEADDVIAYICQMPSLSDDVKIIVSMDKDFYQLCDDKTMIYSPVKNEFLNKKRILEKFSIHPNNFALARAIDGDKSDNLDGIKGAGLKTIANKFSFLAEEKSYTLDELFKHCRRDDSGLKLYKNILAEKNKVKINYKLMQLYSPYISTKSSQHIKDTVENFDPKFNLTNVMKMMSQDGIHQYNWNNQGQTFPP